MPGEAAANVPARQPLPACSSSMRRISRAHWSENSIAVRLGTGSTSRIV
jgi:hypothetical protein